MQPIMPKVVYDTNVLISGMVWGGVPYDCIELAKRDRVVGLTCAEILLNKNSSQARVNRLHQKRNHQFVVSRECITFPAHLRRTFDNVLYRAILLVHVEVGGREVGHRVSQISGDR